MDLEDPVDRRAAALFGNEAGIPDLTQASLVLAASDAGMRDHYRHRAIVLGARLLVHADAHFRMGAGHEAEGSPCQDWATASVAGAPAFGIVSDGCSTSGRTDLGARLLGLAAARIVSRSEGGETPLPGFLSALLSETDNVSRLLDLRPGDLDATLGFVAARPLGGARAGLFGDGLVAARTPEGLDVRMVEWVGNMPAYPAYGLLPERRDAFIRQSEIFAAEAGRPACLVTRYTVDPAGGIDETEVQGLSAEEGLGGLEFAWDADVRLDAVAVLTDGAAQFSGAGWDRVVPELTAFKAAREGEFVRRRMTRALFLLAKGGHRPVDDIAVAAIAAAGGTYA